MPIKDSLRLLVQGVRRISFDGENIERNQALRTDQNGTYYFNLYYVMGLLRNMGGIRNTRITLY